MQDWCTILESLMEKSLALGADAADAVWFDTTDLSLSCRHGRPEGIERSESRALCLRAFVGQSQAMVSSTDMSEASLTNLAEYAVSMAKLAPADALSALADSALYPKKIPALDLCDDVEPTPEHLFEQARECEAVALAISGITNSEGADASYSRSNIGLMIARASNISFAESYASSHSSLSVSVLAGSGTDMQRDYDFSAARHKADLKEAETIGRNAAHRALKRMFPRKIVSGNLPVIYDRRVSKQLLSALASSINGSSIVRGSSFLQGDMGKAVFGKNIHIFDDPHIIRGMASKPFDGEGVATKKRTFVEGGIVQSWVLDVRSANALELTTTGHATRGLGSPPSPSTTNLYMQAGSDSPEALIKNISRGLLITETFGTGINTMTGDYSQGASGFMIENGEVAYAIADITIAGHLREMFARLIPASDLVFDYSTNAPSLLIDGMAVAGA